MAKSLEETLKDLRAGGYSEGSVRNYLVNKGFPSAKVDKAMALRTAKDSRRARLHRALDCVLDRSAAARGKDADTRGAAARQLDDEYDNILGQISDLTEEYEEMESDWQHGRGSQSELNYMGRETTRMERELDKLDKKKTAIEQKAKAAKIVLKKPRW